MDQKKTEVLRREYEELLYAISHNLRAPLRSILAVVDWMKEDFEGQLDERGSELLALMETGSHRLSVKMERLVEFGRSGRLKDDYLIDWIGVEERLRLQFPTIDLTTQGEVTNLGGDTELFSKLFFELLDNTVAFSTEEHPRVSIVLQEDDSGADIVVEDRGAGIKEGLEEKVFELFFTSTAEDEFKHCGMGLPICRRIVTEHGGTISAAKGADGGMAVRIRWPQRGNDATAGGTE